MTILKKVFLWLKNYWYFPVVFVAILIAFVFHRGKVEQLVDLLIGSMESHKNELAAVNSANEKENAKIEKSAKKFSKDLQDIVSEESAALEKAEGDKRKREKDLKDLEMELLAEEMKKAFSKKE